MRDVKILDRFFNNIIDEIRDRYKEIDNSLDEESKSRDNFYDEIRDKVVYFLDENFNGFEDRGEEKVNGADEFKKSELLGYKWIGIQFVKKCEIEFNICRDKNLGVFKKMTVSEIKRVKKYEMNFNRCIRLMRCLKVVRLSCEMNKAVEEVVKGGDHCQMSVVKKIGQASRIEGKVWIIG